jgi:deoxyribodipyrimidine photo-lyase
MSSTQLVWLRHDLRLHDHPALHFAQQAGDIHVIYIATPQQWQSHDEGAAKMGLRAASLCDVATRFARLGIPFTYYEVPTFADSVKSLVEFCQQHLFQTVWFQQETPLDEVRRDHAASEALTQLGMTVEALPPDLFVSRPLLNKQALPFKVFTPYYKTWLQRLVEQDNVPLPPPHQQGAPYPSTVTECAWAGEYRSDLWPCEESAVLDKAVRFCEHKIRGYLQHRDYPAIAATSTLSPHLVLGQIGPRTLLQLIQQASDEHHQDWLHDGWLRELAWRDFYKQLLDHFPELCKHRPFKAETDLVPWRYDMADFEAWCQGKTGFPIIDAAMRQLNQTGWMHNRLRMLTASFLSKLLLIDWRWGERYFMNTLVDADFASNNGGWQWSASTGVDAAPYFRIFNPTTQSEKFDPEGEFIARFVPELAQLPAKKRHFPDDALRAECGYPAPMIDYRKARQHALEAFKLG